MPRRGGIRLRPGADADKHKDNQDGPKPEPVPDPKPQPLDDGGAPVVQPPDESSLAVLMTFFSGQATWPLRFRSAASACCSVYVGVVAKPRTCEEIVLVRLCVC